MKLLINTKGILLVLLILSGCASQQEKPVVEVPVWQPYDESAMITTNADHPSGRMRFKHIQSVVSDKNDIWKQLGNQLAGFTEQDYQDLHPMIMEKDIPTIQSFITDGQLTYEQLTKWYLHRIVKFENDTSKHLNAIISINPNAVDEAKRRDQSRSADDHPIFGMPVLLKDNIGFEGLPTTAGAMALMNNDAPDAFIVQRIEEKGGIILGKLNLSEWANFLSDGNPNGWSVVGGQTLNPYGRGEYDTGGSSSASGVSMAANFAVAAVGTETAGSILSPASSNSTVGLKPTIGLLSRGGIVPISSTLDTPGPITRNVTDNAILLDAMTGEDPRDSATKGKTASTTYISKLQSGKIAGTRFGVNQNYYNDTTYAQIPYQRTVELIRTAGGEMIKFEPGNMNYDGFVDLLSADMKIDLPAYFRDYAGTAVSFKTVADVVQYNLQDTVVRIPYGQARFDGIVETNLTEEELIAVRDQLNEAGTNYLEAAMRSQQLDVILSVNNWDAAIAAVAKYPCLTIPMGYTDTGAPIGLTLIGRPMEEEKLLQ
ncbi:MAG: amidase family protein, partial [Bacteroidota bacterium]